MLKLTAFNNEIKMVMCVCNYQPFMFKNLIEIANDINAEEILIGDYNEESDEYVLKEKYFKIKSHWYKQIDL